MSFSNRMDAGQIERLALAIAATAETLGQIVTSTAANMMADDLADYEPGAVRAALKACRRDLKGQLTLGAILDRVHATDGRPGRDEAWAVALSASDEYTTVVLTQEIRGAMAASAPVLAAGDKIGARMAFLSAYDRLVSAARATATPAQWEVSLGQDPTGCAIAIEQAVRAGLLPQERANMYLDQLAIKPAAITQDGHAIAGLIKGEVRPASADVRRRLDGIRQQIKQNQQDAERRRRKQGQRDRVDTYLGKRRLRAALAESPIPEVHECQ